MDMVDDATGKTLAIMSEEETTPTCRGYEGVMGMN